MTTSRPNAPSANAFWQKLLGLIAGTFLALCLLKFGNPVIFEEKIAAPRDLFEFLLSTWPIPWGYVALGLLLLAALPVANWKKRTAPRWLLCSLLVWLAWQLIAATQTVDAKLTSATVRHFSTCVACFFIGYFSLSELRSKTLLWAGLLVGYILMLKAGFGQHFGGLEETRRYFELYVAPTLSTPLPPEYLAKMSSNRIFGTLFYPNSLAGAILLGSPILTSFLLSLIQRRSLRWFALLSLTLPAVAALIWSGSKAGWLLALVMAGIGLLHLPLARRTRILLVSSFLVLGLSAFGLKYAGFFKKGATSVVARTDYWRAAVKIGKESPLFGTGPGTFMIPYAKMKAPEAEMTRLCHNDYLQQVSDSGWIGFVAYAVFIWGGLIYLYRIRVTAPAKGLDLPTFALWLGLTGLALHSLVEFHLYIAGLAWTFFLLFGMLCGVPANRIDKAPSTVKVAAQ